MVEIDDTARLLLVKMKIKREVSVKIRNYARIFMLFFAAAILFIGVGLPPPSTVWMMTFTVILVLILIPILTAIIMIIVIKYETDREFKKYLVKETEIERK